MLQSSQAALLMGSIEQVGLRWPAFFANYRYIRILYQSAPQLSFLGPVFKHTNWMIDTKGQMSKSFIIKKNNNYLPIDQLCELGFDWL